MEGYLYKWINMISGWKPRYVSILDGRIEVSQTKNEVNKKVYNLVHINIIDYKKCEFQLIDKDNQTELFFKTFSEIEKASWIFHIKDEQSKTKCTIMKKNQKTNRKSTLSDEKEKVKNQDPIKFLETGLLSIQENVHEMNIALSLLNEHLQTINNKNHPLVKAYDQFFKIKQNLRQNIDDTIICVVDLKQQNKKREEIFYDALETFNDINEKDNKVIRKIDLDDIKSDLSDDTFDECHDLANIEITFDSVSLSKLEHSLGKKKDNNILALKNSYDYEIRKALSKNIKSSTSMISDLVKNLMKERASLPITYNEPLSMLQRCIEPFQNFYLVEKAYSEQNIEDKLSWIAGFVMSEFSFNINRLLKPFNPLLGETFEYVDKKNNFIAFAEQVSHHPPISAYLVESSKITIFGDTKNKHKFALLKGSVEMTFHSKTNILFHETKEKEINNLVNSATNHFCYNKPLLYMKGIIYGTPHYDIVGKVKIEDLKNPNSWVEIEFIEEGKKGFNFGDVQGRIVKDNQTKYILQGNWLSGLSIYSESKELIKEIWKISNDKFITNKDSINNYLLSEYSYDLNNLPDSLKKVIPITDSRLRPDQRELENGNIEDAEQLKLKLEEEQRVRAKLYEVEKKIYNPNYFKLVTNNEGSFYIPSNSYWEDRLNGSFDHLVKIFNIH